MRGFPLKAQLWHTLAFRMYQRYSVASNIRVRTAARLQSQSAMAEMRTELRRQTGWRTQRPGAPPPRAAREARALAWASLGGPGAGALTWTARWLTGSEPASPVPDPPLMTITPPSAHAQRSAWMPGRWDGPGCASGDKSQSMRLSATDKESAHGHLLAGKCRESLISRMTATRLLASNEITGPGLGG